MSMKHISIVEQEGKSEEQISHELGNPKSIAKELRATAAVERAKSNSSISNIFLRLLQLWDSVYSISLLYCSPLS